MSRNGINIDDVINKSVKAAIKEYDREKVLSQKKTAFHNTRLLLSHYNDLKDHVKNSIDDASKLETDWFDIDDLDRDEIYILSIKRSKTKTLIMIAHIDMALNILKQKQIKGNCLYKYQALEMYYLDEMTYENIQDHFQCSKNTPGRWINQMIIELSILVFGIEGLKLDMI